MTGPGTDDLRATLRQHAAGLEDTPLTRVTPVHHRVRTIRRRRAGGAAGALVVALVVVGVGVGPGLLSHRADQSADHDAPSRLAGRVVPSTTVATGFTYRYVRGYQSRAGDGSLDVDVRVGDRPMLVRWASSDSSSVPDMRLDDGSGDGPELSAAGGFRRYTELYAADEGETRTAHLRLTQTNPGERTRVALAVYDLPDADAAGVGNGAVVFRREVAGESLVRAEIAKPGTNDLSFRVRVPSTDLGFAATCYHSRRWTRVSVDGRPLLGTACAEQPQLDAGSGPATFDGSDLGEGVRAGDTVTVRVHLSPSAKRTGQVVSDPDAVVGLGVYTHTAPTTVVGAVTMPQTVELDGHTWHADGFTYAAPPGERSLQITLRRDSRDSDVPRLVEWTATGLSPRGSRVSLSTVSRAGGRTTPLGEYSSGSGPGTSSGSALVVQPGQTPTVTVSVPQGVTSRTRLGLVVYDQLRH